MSKVCLIGLANIRHISLISLYTAFLDAHQIPYDLIYIDRYGIDEPTTAANQYVFRAGRAKTRLGKLGSFLRFRRFVRDRIRENRYDSIITWQTNTAYLLADILMGRYAGRYVVNVRDYIMENLPPIRLLLKALKKRAAFVTVSSGGFRAFLPPGEYVQVNSIHESLLEGAPQGERSCKMPYKIGFVGNCRFFRENFRIIDALANDPRFELWYCGTGSEVLADYAREKGIGNVFAMPAFSPEQTVPIMGQFHMINSAFGSDAMDNRTLMPIRLYTAIGLHIPVLVSGGTYLAEQVRRAELGFVADPDGDLAGNLAAYFEGLDSRKLAEACDRYLARARRENEKFNDILCDFFGVAAK